ncbi:MAG: 3-deoxy-D-manno-octulosonic acid transferase [Rickettsiales bacterium]|nr:MAG: 3-deoxy-D-manno-octulosonic acid transferase [Rickettsiales bacterium]
MIFIYNLLSLLLFPIYLLVLLVRLCKKKENLKSILQRHSLLMPSRPDGQLVWIHAASVGESMVALTLIKAISTEHPKMNFLVTTGTLSSAGLLANWLPSNAQHQGAQHQDAQHQFVPIDNILIVRKFLKHWRPKLGIFIESEFWPCLINESAKNFDLILANARLSDRSFARWQKRRGIFNFITSKFKTILVQSKTDLDKYQNLGCGRAINLGNLKFANKELEVDTEKLASLKSIFGDKKIFLASSTHKEDEEVTLKIIKSLKQKNIDYYPIIILRHPERVGELAKACAQLGLKFSIRSKSPAPSLGDDLYIVDSFGELGLFYSLAYISFIGGSFKHGGHNLVEPAYFDNVILLGPDMSNFQNIADDMTSHKAAIQVRNAEELAEQIEFFLDEKNSKERSLYSANAQNFVDSRKETLNNYLTAIDKFLK